MGDEHGGAALRAVDTEAAADDVSAFPEPGKPAARSERRAAASVVFDAEFQAAVDALGGDLDAGRLSMPHRVRAGFPGDQIGGLFHVGSETGIGIVAAVGRLLADHGYDISYSQQFDDRQSNRFFMRVEASAPQSADLDRLRREFGRVVASFSMKWFLGASNDETRTLLMVSHADRYIKELIDLSQSGLLKIEIAGIVGNHDSLRHIADQAGLPFHHVPVTKERKPEAEAELLRLVQTEGVELVVLARYMQILSDDLCSKLEGRVINIHHSFLPGSKGARPYHQAFERGVKIVGATAHYVTAALDEGPIIEVGLRGGPSRRSTRACNCRS